MPYGNNPADNPHSATYWSLAHVALQLRLGLLPEQWSGTRFADFDHPAGHGTDMKSLA
jgi:hypothetical protein